MTTLPSIINQIFNVVEPILSIQPGFDLLILILMLTVLDVDCAGGVDSAVQSDDKPTCEAAPQRSASWSSPPRPGRRWTFEIDLNCRVFSSWHPLPLQASAFSWNARLTEQCWTKSLTPSLPIKNHLNANCTRFQRYPDKFPLKGVALLW